jgi:peptidase E
MKLMLTSDGFTTKKLFNEFVKLVGKPANEIKIVVIPTAASYIDNYLPDRARDSLLPYGILKKNVTRLELDHKIKYSEVDGFDVILVGGGNTFLLLDKAKKSGFKKILDKFLQEGVYIGISAGSIIMGPGIEISTIGDKNFINLKDLTGLNYVDFGIAPHKDTQRFIERGRTEEAVQELAKTLPYEIVSITDFQAVIVVDGKKRLVG